MDVQVLVAEYGWVALFVFSFISATIIPLSSEAILLAGIAAGMPVLDALVACSTGNCLACVLNYYLGRLAGAKMRKKLEQSRSGRTTLQWMHRYGVWSLLGSWLPFVGDPLTVVAGLAEIPLLVFSSIVFPLRILRYVVLILFVRM